MVSKFCKKVFAYVEFEILVQKFLIKMAFLRLMFNFQEQDSQD